MQVRGTAPKDKHGSSLRSASLGLTQCLTHETSGRFLGSLTFEVTAIRTGA